MTGGSAVRISLILLPLLSGCGLFKPVETLPVAPTSQVDIVEDPVPIDWRSVITAAGQDKLARLDEAWRQGLAAARSYRTAMGAEGPLLDPTVALPRAAPSPGPYQCRVVKLGGRPAFMAYKSFNCFVEAEGELLTMVKQSGTQRPAGRLWGESDTRLVFLGALSAGEDGPPPYAAQPARDVVGYLERVDTFRWRLAVPFPQDGAAIDLYELVPIVPTQP